MNKGDIVKLCFLRELDCGFYKGRFIVVSRYPEDRSSGGTTIMYEDGGRKEFIWDYDNPEVTYIGKGDFKTIINFPKGD